MTDLTLFSPSGAVAQAAALRRAERRLQALGYAVRRDAAVLARDGGLAGSDATRLEALHRVAAETPAIALATRGGYGLTRLLDRIDWPLLARSVEAGTRWVGFSDVTLLQLGLLRHAGAPSWAGPMAIESFGRSDADGGVDDVTRDCFVEAMSGALEAVGFRTDAGHDGLAVQGRLWGGNLAVLVSLLGTPHWPAVRGGVLFVEDVAEPPYRVERMLLQLHQAGVLDRQKAVLLGSFSGVKPPSSRRDVTLAAALARVRSVTRTPLLSGLPFGHVQPKVTLPVGARVEVTVAGRDVLVAWGHA